MKLLQSPLFDEIRTYLTKVENDDQIFLYVPYIKTKVLEKLIEGIQNDIIIITNWDGKNLLSGSSELELYPFCKQKNITLYSHKKMHLKVYSINLESAIIGSGNISERGLNPDNKEIGTYEAATILEELSVMDKLYLKKIKHDATWINDQRYAEYKEWYDKHPKPKEIKIEEIKLTPKKDDFSIDILPWTENVFDLIDGYEKISNGFEPSKNSYTLKCITNDISNYEIKPGLSKEEFSNELKKQFFSHPFIKKIIEIIDKKGGEIYFGDLRNDLERRIITDVPPPDRQDVNICLRIIYDWFRDLGDGKYGWDQPSGRGVSQRLWKK